MRCTPWSASRVWVAFHPPPLSAIGSPCPQWLSGSSNAARMCGVGCASRSAQWLHEASLEFKNAVNPTMLPMVCLCCIWFAQGFTKYPFDVWDHVNHGDQRLTKIARDRMLQLLQIGWCLRMCQWIKFQLGSTLMTDSTSQIVEMDEWIFFLLKSRLVCCDID